MSDEIRPWRERVRRVVAHHFGSRPARLTYKSSGLSNFVFAVKHAEGNFVVRLSPEATKINAFYKEQWAHRAAREAGVPTAEILEVGNEVVPYPYMIVRQCEGVEAVNHPRRQRVLREMGRLAALIHTIPTSGFGDTFDWSSNRLSRHETFAAYLAHGWQGEAKLLILEEHGMVSVPQGKALRKILAQAARREVEPRLAHGDLRLKNVIVNPQGEIMALLDWEHCTSNIAPHWDMSLALHDLGIDGKQEFLAGYGLSGPAVAELMPLVKTFNILNYAPTIAALVKAKDQTRLAEYRTRLSGALDLYSLV